MRKEEERTKQFAIGIDLGGTNFRIGAVTSHGEIRHFQKSSSRIFENGNAAVRLAEAVEKYIGEYALEDEVLGVAIGVPSAVSRDRKRMLSTPNLKGFDGVDLVGILEEKLRLPVFLDRDVHFLLLDDLEKLALQTEGKTVLGFYVGTGLGNAILLDGKLYRGKNGVAGELGHIPLKGIEDICACGNRGCAETRMSGRYLEHLAAEHFPREDVHFLFSLHKNHPILEEYVQSLALPIAAEINILDPDVVILSGGVLEMPDFPKNLLKESILEHLRKPYPYENLSLYFMTHTGESAVRGSGLSVFRTRENKAAQADF